MFITSTFETYVDVFEGNKIVEHLVEVETSCELLDSDVIDNVRINTIFSLDKDRPVLQNDLTKQSKEVLNNKAYNSLLDNCEELVNDGVGSFYNEDEWYE